MRISIVFIILSTFLLINSSFTQFTIDITADDAERIGEIVSESLTNLGVIQPFSPAAIICKHAKKVAVTLLQMTGLMITLVGANILTSIFDPNIIIHSEADIVQVNPPKFEEIDYSVESEKCGDSYGCDNNKCWASCNATVFIHNFEEKTIRPKLVKSWCYTSPNPAINKNFKQCNHGKECSSCWSCLGACNPKN